MSSDTMLWESVVGFGMFLLGALFVLWIGVMTLISQRRAKTGLHEG